MSLKNVLLITLQKGDMTGYELAKEYDDKSANFWQASHQQIYRELKKMANEGLISCIKQAQQGKPDKKIYKVTQQGQQALEQWLAQPTSERLLNSPFLAKFMAGECANASSIRDDIVRLQQEHGASLAKFESFLDHFPSDKSLLSKGDKLAYLSLQRGIIMEQAWLSWAEQVLPELNELAEQEQQEQD
ncbi:PadR family transcriptional regulator [Motilimonas eburnea]|uniref:PadR family transcriptional regulator n=1 Tax=Motilimonas eburnea TaxID=1737488 RepID=UPI001E442626|nr:PadR family transcriptional regulator [Motilimonas eburnea]MCE2573014.1 PadR family transcriptional regulator [Motilimonas eburnea]